MISKTKIINVTEIFTSGNLEDNYGNSISITGRARHASLRYGDKMKIFFTSSELPLKNAVYFTLTIPRTDINSEPMRFVFPAFFIQHQDTPNTNKNE